MGRNQKKLNARICRVILPEGERSEPEYLKLIAECLPYDESKIVRFARHYPDGEGGGVVLLHKGSNQGGWKLNGIINEVKRIRELLSDQSQNLSYYEFWAVFDADDMSNKSILNRLAEISKTGGRNEIQVAISIPCFEAFLLAHFIDVNTFLEPLQGQPLAEIRKKVTTKLHEYYQSEYGLNYEKQVQPEMIECLDTAPANIPSWPKKERLKSIKTRMLPPVACSIDELIRSIQGNG